MLNAWEYTYIPLRIKHYSIRKVIGSSLIWFDYAKSAGQKEGPTDGYPLALRKLKPHVRSGETVVANLTGLGLKKLPDLQDIP